MSFLFCVSGFFLSVDTYSDWVSVSVAVVVVVDDDEVVFKNSLSHLFQNLHHVIFKGTCVA